MGPTMASTAQDPQTSSSSSPPPLNRMEDAPPEQKTYATKFDKYRAGNADLAQRMQTQAGIRGGLGGLAVGSLLMLFAQARYPWVRRQTLAGKAFLACWPAAFGFTIYAENALMAFEKDNQGYDNAVRQKAMQELGKMGKMSTETNIRLWRDKYEEAFFQSQQAQGSVQAGKS